MKRFTTIPVILLFTIKSFSQITYTGGLPDDGQVHLPPNYTTFSPPAKGTIYADDFYGTTITRLSNGYADFNDAVHHEYSPINAFNSNSTYILLARDMGAFFVVDSSGNIVVTNAELSLSNGSEPRWSKTNPDVFYYHDYASNEMKMFHVSTKQASVYKKFNQFSAITFGGGGDSDISEDGDHVVICGDGRYVGVYEFSTDSLYKTLDTQGLGTGFAFFDMTADNHVCARWNDKGAGRYKGFELFDKEMNFIRQVHMYGAHSDFGRDVDGDEVLVVAAYSDLNPPQGCGNNGVEVVKLKDGSRTCVIGFNWDSELHVSMASKGPWLIVDEIELLNSCSEPNATLPSNWQSAWKQYTNEVVLVKADGSEIRRLVHHESRRYTNCYWCQPRASMSQDGRFALFDSNFGTQPIPEYSDVFKINLGKKDISTQVQKGLNSSDLISIFPNPATSEFQIKLNGFINDETVRVQVINLLGEIVFQKEISARVTLDINMNHKGVYLVKTEGLNTGKVFTKKLVIEN